MITNHILNIYFASAKSRLNILYAFYPQKNAQNYLYLSTNKEIEAQRY